MEKKYSFDEVKAFAIIAFNNYIHSGNKDDKHLKTFEMFIDPLEEVHKQDNVIEYADKLKKFDKIFCST